MVVTCTRPPSKQPSSGHMPQADELQMQQPQVTSDVPIKAVKPGKPNGFALDQLDVGMLCPPAILTSPQPSSSRLKVTSTPTSAGQTYTRPGGVSPKHRAPPRGTPGLVKQLSSLGSPWGSQASQASPMSVSSSTDDGLVDETEAEGESLQVFVRVRPHNAQETRTSMSDPNDLQPMGPHSVTCIPPSREPKTFRFDQVLWMSPQQEVFEVVGQTMVEHCITGYNASIFAYGQTGAGKTYTMMGTVVPPGEPASEQRGLAPRIFEYLYDCINQDEDAKGRENVRYSCRCSFLEIYNETITDLLNPASNNLLIREDQRSPFVENLTEVPTQNVDDVLALMRKGAENRHVGETRMNRESSRSHSVFTCIIEKHSKSTTDGVATVVVSRLNLIDLAGSERISSGAFGGSQVQGTHFKEAVHINKSLTTLGRVIMELVDAQRYQKRNCHIPYRDSRLTFLLQDSLGGNAKTMIIANVSPSVVCAQETLSTLQFVSRAKAIRNKAHINLDFRGDVASLQKEITRLNKELEDIRQNNTEAAFQAAADLRKELASEQQKCQELEQKTASLAVENRRLRWLRNRLEDHLNRNRPPNTSSACTQTYETSTAHDDIIDATAHVHDTAVKRQLEVATMARADAAVVGQEVVASILEEQPAAVPALLHPSESATQLDKVTPSSVRQPFLVQCTFMMIHLLLATLQTCWWLYIGSLSRGFCLLMWVGVSLQQHLTRTICHYTSWGRLGWPLRLSRIRHAEK